MSTPQANSQSIKLFAQPSTTKADRMNSSVSMPISLMSEIDAICCGSKQGIFEALITIALDDIAGMNVPEPRDLGTRQLVSVRFSKVLIERVKAASAGLSSTQHGIICLLAHGLKLVRAKDAVTVA